MITSVDNFQVKHWVKLKHNRDYRYDHEKVLVEGKNTIKELAARDTPLTLIATSENLIPPHKASTKVVLVSSMVMEKITEVEESEGIIAEMKMPSWSTLENKKWILVLDKVSDPGNVGTLIRTSLALGFDGVFLSHEGCDPYNDKALRAAKGATFRHPLRMGDIQEALDLGKKNGLPLIAADVKGKSFHEFKNLNGALLILGNESYGVSEPVLNHAKRISIPIRQEMESLNVAVAGGILMCLLRGL